MAIKYTCRKLAGKELEESERVLLEQMDQQGWFSVVIMAMWRVEVILPLN